MTKLQLKSPRVGGSFRTIIIFCLVTLLFLVKLKYSTLISLICRSTSNPYSNDVDGTSVAGLETNQLLLVLSIIVRSPETHRKYIFKSIFQNG